MLLQSLVGLVLLLLSCACAAASFCPPQCAAPSRFWPPSAWVHVLSKSASSPVPTPRTVIVTSASNGSDAVEVPVADNKGSVSLPVEKSEAEAALVAVSQSEEFELAALKKSLWWRCGEKALRWPYNLLCVVRHRFSLVSLL